MVRCDPNHRDHASASTKNESQRDGEHFDLQPILLSARFELGSSLWIRPIDLEPNLTYSLHFLVLI